MISCHECQIRKTSILRPALFRFLHRPGLFKYGRWIYVVHFLFLQQDIHSLTVCNVIYRLFTTFGVCRTILSDQGSEFIAKSTKKLCKLMNVPQEFTPSFAHHCLGACERSHRTLEERMIPYIRQGKSWHDILPAIVFSMNSCVNSSTNYSPFEVVYCQTQMK